MYSLVNLSDSTTPTETIALVCYSNWMEYDNKLDSEGSEGRAEVKSSKRTFSLQLKLCSLWVETMVDWTAENLLDSIILSTYLG